MKKYNVVYVDGICHWEQAHVVEATSKAEAEKECERQKGFIAVIEVIQI